MKEFIVFFWDTILEQNFSRSFAASSEKQIRNSYSVKQFEIEGHKIIAVEQRSFQTF